MVFLIFLKIKMQNITRLFPFSIQEIIKERGGDFQFSEEGWDGFMVSDGRLISGQDPSAAGLVAEKVIETLEQL